MTEISHPSADEDLVFICGALRSGTTLLRLMVNHHPALINPGEMDFLFEPPPLKDGQRYMAAYAHELSFNRVFNAKGLKLRDGLGYEDQVRDFVCQLRAPDKRLSINIHRHFDRIPAIFSNARYVHLLRDPRDVAKSSIAMGWAGNVYHGVDHWISSERDFALLARSVDPALIHTMKNEDLIRAPEKELSRLCAFLGVAYDAKMLEYPSHTTYSRPDPKLVEQWRTELSDREVSLIEGKVGAMLTERGYQPSGRPPLAPGGIDLFLLKQANRLGRIRFSMKRNGVLLTAFDLATRFIPIASLKTIARRKLAARELRFLK
jgi:hypothetical protein